MFFKRNDVAVKDEQKIVYIFKFTLRRDDDIFKIGITSRSDVQQRYSEVLLAFYQQFRYVPNSSIRRFSGCNDAEAAEKELLQLGKPVNFQKKFSGYSEFRFVDEDELLEAYDIIVKGKQRSIDG